MHALNVMHWAHTCHAAMVVALISIRGKSEHVNTTKGVTKCFAES